MSTLRTLLRVDIQIDQDWAVGAAPDLWFRPDDATTEDDARSVRLPVQRDPSDGLLLPATSLVGSLRRHLGTAAALWLGDQHGDSTTPSELRCLAATIHPVEARTVTTTAIDPQRRAAEGGTLRREEVLPPTRVTWWIEWDHHDPDLCLVDLVTALKHWRPVVGRRRSANRGRAHVEAIFHRTVDLATEDGLTWWLGTRPTLPWTSQDPLPTKAWTRVAGEEADEGTPVITRRLMVADALHLGGPGRTENLLRTAHSVSSTSWRGVFRSRVAHIVRVTTDGTPDEVKQRVAEVQARLFGSGRGKGASSEAGHRGQLRFGDSPVHGTVRQRTHVAIDRVSGGTVERFALDPKDDAGMLFAVEHYGPGATVDLKIYNDSDVELAASDRDLLKAVIRDIEDGVIGIGAMTSRGYGTLTAQEGQE